jgi:hypothetical protein
MNDEAPATGGEGIAGWVIAALIVAAIVALVLFARGPEGQDRSAAPPALTALLVEA